MTETAEERTLPPTPKRRAEAVARGEAAHSGLLTSAAVLLTVLAWIAGNSSAWTAQLGLWWREQWQAPLSLSGDVAPLERLSGALWTLLAWSAGLGLVGVATALGVEWAQRGIRIQAARLAPDASRLASGTTRVLAGLNPLLWLAEGLRWLAPTVTLLALLWVRRERLAALLHADPVAFLSEGGALGMEVLTRLTVTMLLLALGHYAWRRRQWERALRMTVPEYRAEQERKLPPPRRLASTGQRRDPWSQTSPLSAR